MLWCNGPCILGKEMLAWQGRLWTDALKHMAYSLNLHAPDHQTSSWELGKHTSPSKVNPRALGSSWEEDVASRVEGIERQDLDEPSLKDTIYCLYAPPMYFSKILDSVMKANANKNEKEALTRVIVTQANVDIKVIAEEYNKQYGTPLTKKIEDVALGNYKDFLVTNASSLLETCLYKHNCIGIDNIQLHIVHTQLEIV
ncbi:hypothetical protein VitviT2T_020384 [Vitis vinifera]|uniref:Annexin D4 n=1 Tax=Vitis vinifera TaxID=29760 RepID=A0ABY9D3U3_VITVI|nr:hypothetical protein VitviT2T_020384 [Vitis vinifera]